MTAISDAKLNVEDYANIKGVLRYSSLKEKRNPSKNPGMGKDVYYVTLSDPEVVNSNNKKGFEDYIKIHGFTSKARGTGSNGEFRVRFQNGSPFAPKIFDETVRDPDGTPSNELLDNELANGQEVTIRAHVFPSSLNPGMNLDAVLIKDANHIEYVQSGGLSIRSFGLEPNPTAQPKASTETTESSNNSNQAVQDNPFGKTTTDTTSEKSDYKDPFNAGSETSESADDTKNQDPFHPGK